MQIVIYPHPTLRHKSKPVKRVDAGLRSIVQEMLERMYESQGVGLAANQVDLPFRFFVANLESDPQKSEELVFINPVISRPKGQEENSEGCLSFPTLYCPVRRPARVHVNAYDLNGREISADVDGLLARVIQHETDHLDGILFVDRMSATAKLDVAEALNDFEVDFRSRQGTGGIPSDEAIGARLVEWESKYC
ncbi:MAG: peptide deformylase [Pirellulaceae bacterium]